MVLDSACSRHLRIAEMHHLIDPTCRFCIDSVFLVLLFRGGLIQWTLLGPSCCPQEDAPLREGPPASTAMLSFHSCGPGVFSV